MAKRFFDTDKYKNHFIRSLKAPYKLLWDYILCDCNHAGIWIVDFEAAQLYLGKDIKLNEKDALCFFNADKTRIIPIDNGLKWFIVPFIEFQYGELNENNRAHNSVICMLRKYDLLDANLSIIQKEAPYKPLTTPIEGCKDKDKDKYMDKDKNKIEGLREEGKERDRSIIKQSDIDYLYSLYPPKCPNRNKSNGKGIKDKDKIRNILKTTSKEELEFTIKAYVQQCIENKEWMKNFSTFLNNLPDMGYCRENINFSSTPQLKDGDVNEKGEVWSEEQQKWLK